MKKSGIRILSAIAILILSMNSCKKDEATLPVLSAVNVTVITSTSASVIAKVTSDGGAKVTERGVCWSTFPNPTIGNSKATNGSLGTGSYTTNISGLTGNTTYYVRAYATNSAGTGYSEEKTFVSSAISEYATTFPATDLYSASATLNGMVNANFMSTTVGFEYGTTTSYGNSITASQSPVTGNSNTPVSASLNGLSLLATYHFRVKIVNSSGTSYGDDMTFTTNYIIGGNYLGGIIFYIDSTGHHGLICATTDQSTGAEWGCYGTAITGADGTALGTGLQNTIDIMNGCATAGIAARLCRGVTINGYSDWFLPSKDELNMMYLNLKVQGLGGFASSLYWSSSEYGAGVAWLQYLVNGYQDCYGTSTTHYVRAVKAF